MKTLHVDDFAALNNELRALAAAGIPLPDGLRAVSAEYPGRVGTAAGAIAHRLESGQSLESALVEEIGLNEAYAVVISAGLQSGNLARALEGVATTAQRIASLRRLILVSLAYPCLLMVIAYGLFIFLLGSRELFVDDLYPVFGLGRSPFSFYGALHSTMLYWAWVPPILFLLAIGSAIWLIGRGGTSRMKLPLIQDTIRFGRIAVFLDLLRLLVSNDAPLDEACSLAGRASADPGMRASGEQLAEKLRSGVQSAAPQGNEIPPMIQWMILSNSNQQTLIANLRRSVESYTQRTERMSAWLSLYIPLIFSLALGGGATILFAMFVLGPWFHFLYRLGVTA